uniref:Histone acetyltransferase n=1 Tax=Eptatretus burgeri TaxID=7764 RepID=A0A8C4QW43_EPTBU
MPQFMKQGYGKMLIEFSYLLSKVEDKVGSPERPLSDLGLISYRSYWKSVLLRYLHNYQGKEISIKEMSQETAVNPADIVSTLQYLQMLKYWKGKHLVLKRQVRLEGFSLGQPFVLNASFIFPNYMMLSKYDGLSFPPPSSNNCSLLSFISFSPPPRTSSMSGWKRRPRSRPVTKSLMLPASNGAP